MVWLSAGRDSNFIHVSIVWLALPDGKPVVPEAIRAYWLELASKSTDWVGKAIAS